MVQFVDARGFALTPQITDTGGFARGMEQMMARKRASDREQQDAESMRQAGMMIQLLESEDAAPVIDHFYRSETNPSVHDELGKLRDIYAQDPALARSIIEGELRGDKIGNQLLMQRQQERLRMQQSASARGFAPTPVRVEIGTDQDGNPIYETQMVGVSFDPRTNQYATQNIPLGGDIIGFEEEKAAARGRGAETGKIEANVGAADKVADTEAAIVRAKKMAEIFAASDAQAQMDLAEAEAYIPEAIEIVRELSELAPLATHTFPGVAFDAAARELGFGATEGATARAKYEAMVMNNVLPMLRRMLGGAFTEEEGKKVMSLLGDINTSPQEKQQQLNAYIEQKMREIKTLRRKVNKTDQPAPSAPAPTTLESLSDEELFK